MKLAELVKYLKSESHLLKLYQERNLNTESEAMLAYMKGDINVNSDIAFFSIEDTDDERKFKEEGVEFFQLFPLEHGVEIYSYFDDEFKRRNYSDLEKAKRLLDYIIYDA
ncbi:MAG: hypothetical protein JWQ14_2036 [Adhaeribacter sp.]|nr:hypothetical protein [Adhaeribacter sp.]